MLERTYHDPLHGAITLNGTDPTEALLIQLIDTPAFQRLRRIRQLGPASLTFHGAEGSRFTHSLGVMAIARRAFDRLAKFYPQLCSYRALVLTAALLHDIGHGPFSHTGEEIFATQHERWTHRIVQEDERIRHCLETLQPDFPQQLVQVYSKQFPIPIVWQLVSSQLDCDRLDYLMRDSYFTGASYGKIDLDRILLALRFDPVTQQLVVARKGLAAIEHYLIVRYFMYAQVYNHPKNLAATRLLDQLFKRARWLLRQENLGSDPIMAAWLSETPQSMTLQNYLEADDSLLLYHLQRWRSHSDPILSDLCRRYCDRDLPKAVDLSHLSPAEQQKQFIQAQSCIGRVLPAIATSAIDYYVGLSVSLSRGYTLYQKGINLQTTQGLREISELSPLVKTLVQPLKRTWLICPKEVAIALSID
ncbi:MAG: HD domain-containing protein [Synechococcales bacterium]|nr:HD domain-containing protein [Synechococcales bacterium]